LSGLASCSDCPGNEYSSPGATSCELCLRNFYFSLENTCVECPDGTLCLGDGGSTQETLALAEGFWRVSPSSIDIQVCPLEGACIGTPSENGGTAERALVESFSAYSDGYCAKGYVGPLCAVCDPGGFYFDPDARACESCTKGSGTAAFSSPTMIVLMIVGFLLLVGTAVVLKYGSFGKLKDQAEDAAEAASGKQTKASAIVQALKAQFGIKNGDVTYNKDGTVTLTSINEAKADPKKEESVVQINAPLMSVISKTTVEVSASMKTKLEVTAKPSSKVISFIFGVRKAQVKIKALTSFGQIRCVVVLAQEAPSVAWHSDLLTALLFATAVST